MSRTIEVVRPGQPPTHVALVTARDMVLGFNPQWTQEDRNRLGAALDEHESLWTRLKHIESGTYVVVQSDTDGDLLWVLAGRFRTWPDGKAAGWTDHPLSNASEHDTAANTPTRQPDVCPTCHYAMNLAGECDEHGRPSLRP